MTKPPLGYLQVSPEIDRRTLAPTHAWLFNEHQANYPFKGGANDNNFVYFDHGVGTKINGIPLGGMDTSFSAWTKNAGGSALKFGSSGYRIQCSLPSVPNQATSFTMLTSVTKGIYANNAIVGGSTLGGLTWFISTNMAVSKSRIEAATTGSAVSNGQLVVAGITVASDGKTLKYYLNGNPDGSFVFASAITQNVDMLIGVSQDSAYLGTNEFNWIYYWDRVLSDAEIARVSAYPFLWIDRPKYYSWGTALGAPASPGGGSVIGSNQAMAAEAEYLRGDEFFRKKVAAAVAAGEVHQQAGGYATYKSGLGALVANDYGNFTACGQVTMPKTTSMVLLDGGRAYWDHSANKVHFKAVSDRDFYLGRVVGDCAAADTTCVVNLNADPSYEIDLRRDSFTTALAGTAAAGGFGYPVVLGANRILELTATNEAQKVDLLSVQGRSVSSKIIVEGAFRILSDGAGTVVDLSLGVASATHATDADSIAEHFFIHLDANNTNINAQSKDGTTTVAATDTTIDYTEGALQAQVVEFWMDCRTMASCKLYIDGVRALSGTTFNLGAAVGPLFLLAHLEKTSSTDTYKASVDWLRLRTSEQA